MSFVKRAWLSLVRKPMKSFIIFIILLLSATMLVSISAVERASLKQKEEILDSGSLGFNLRNNPQFAALGPRGMGIIPDQLIQEIKDIEGIAEVNRKVLKVAGVIDGKSVKLDNHNALDRETEELYGQVINLYGEDNTALDVAFKLDSLQLAQGRHITTDDQGKALVHEDFAKLNNLKVGDEVALKPLADEEENPFRAKEEMKLKIVGIFAGKNKQMAHLI